MADNCQCLARKFRIGNKSSEHYLNGIKTSVIEKRYCSFGPQVKYKYYLLENFKIKMEVSMLRMAPVLLGRFRTRDFPNTINDKYYNTPYFFYQITFIKCSIVIVNSSELFCTILILFSSNSSVTQSLCLGIGSIVSWLHAVGNEKHLMSEGTCYIMLRVRRPAPHILASELRHFSWSEVTIVIDNIQHLDKI
ncbi:hypothetical protein AGLY_008715 [Aphis glycines]|uniref:Uncharacterized protein n=1 Tax=Aphis glycines TaxID=307491 RepID=A0A6G0TJJ1_APHGL|nr:hypothetical protein AGLY_008715 [Aphis glycines]